MMLKLVFILLLLFTTFTVKAQLQVLDLIDPSRTNRDLLSSSQSDRVEGTPYFIEEWCYGTIYDKDDSSLGNLPIRYVPYGDFLVIKKDGEDIFVNKNLVKSFSFNHEDKVYQFEQLELPKQGNKFLRILYKSDKLTLYEQYIKTVKLSARQNNGYTPSSHKNDRFVDKSVFYVLYKGRIEKVERKQKSLLNFFEGKKEQIKKFIKLEKINIKQDDDIVKLGSYLNDLL